MNFHLDEEDRIWKDRRDDEGWYQSGSPKKYLLFLVGIILLVIMLWYLFAPAETQEAANDVPVIHAEEGPSKIRVKDAPIPSVRHQDKLVYARIRQDESLETAEHILPDPETPASITPVRNREGTLSGSASEPIKMLQQYTETEEQAGGNAAKADTLVQEKPNPEKLKMGSLEPQKTSLTIEDLISQQEKEGKPPLAFEGHHPKKKAHIMIQLGSLKSPEQAKGEWKRVSQKYKQELASVNPTITRVDLGKDKGIYYRLRVGPFATLAVADSVCKKMKDKKVECVVIDEGA